MSATVKSEDSHEKFTNETLATTSHTDIFLATYIEIR